MVSLFLLLGCNLSYIVDLFATLHELASASARTLLKLTSSVRALIKPYGDTLIGQPLLILSLYSNIIRRSMEDQSKTRDAFHCMEKLVFFLVRNKIKWAFPKEIFLKIWNTFRGTPLFPFCQNEQKIVFKVHMKLTSFIIQGLKFDVLQWDKMLLIVLKI